MGLSTGKIGREGDLVIYYGYDSVDRLTKEEWRKKSNGSQIYAFTYSYDAAGNRLRMRREAAVGVETESAYYTYNAANALTRRRVEPGLVMTYYAYDPNGSLVKQIESAGTTYFAYGPHLLVTKITPPPAQGNPWQFFYDGRLNRYKIDQGGTIGYFLWDGPNLLEERNASGGIVARYTHGYTTIPGIGSVVEVQRVTATTTYFQYMHMDHRGTVYSVTDPGQNTLLSYIQDAFGRSLAATGGTNPNVPNDLVYQTNWKAIVVGGTPYNLSPTRFYFPRTSCFLQRDLLVTSYLATVFLRGYTRDIHELPISLYQYVRNHPVGHVDPFGMEWTRVEEGKDVWCAGEGDTLEGLAQKEEYGGNKENWVCLWPTMDTANNGYPSIKKGDKYDASNLSGNVPANEYSVTVSADVAKFSVSTPKLPENPTLDDFIKAASQPTFVNLHHPREVPGEIRTVCESGGKPVTRMILEGHGDPKGIGGFFGNYNQQTRTYIFDKDLPQFNGDLWSAETDIGPMFESAKKRMGPKRCWFSRTAEVRLAACQSSSVARGFAAVALRKGAHAFGTKEKYYCAISSTGAEYAPLGDTFKEAGIRRLPADPNKTKFNADPWAVDVWDDWNGGL